MEQTAFQTSYGGEEPLAGLAFRQHLGPLFISPDAVDFVTEVSMGSCLVEKGRLKFEGPDFGSASVLCAVKSFRPNVSETQRMPFPHPAPAAQQQASMQKRGPYSACHSPCTLQQVFIDDYAFDERAWRVIP